MDAVMKRYLGTTLALVALTTGGLTVAGCGGDSTPAASTATTGDIASLSGPEILTRAKAATAAATSVTVVGRAPVGADTVGIRMAIGTDVAIGTITLKGLPVQIRVVGGETYIKAPAALYVRKAGRAGRLVAGLVGGKWFAVPPGGLLTDIFRDLLAVTKRDSLINGLFGDGTSPTVAGTDTVLGQPAVVLRRGNGRTLAVAATGEPYPLRVTPKTGHTGSVEFRKWNAPVNVTAPTRNVVNLAALASGARIN